MIVVIFGPGGVGKGTVVRRLLEAEPGLQLSRSWTTRPRRPGEREDAYRYVTHEEFRDRIRQGGFLEWTESASAPGHLYGTPSLSDATGDVLLEIDLDGARQVKARYPESILVLLVAPSPEVQEERLRRRGDAQPAVDHRLQLGREEERLGRQIADHVVINDDVDRAAREVAGILDARRSGQPRR